MKTIANDKATGSEKIAILIGHIGKGVVVANRHDREAIDVTGRTRFHLYGTLEKPDTETAIVPHDEWYARIGECYHGSVGIGFPASDIVEMNELLTGTLQITLK